MYSVPESNHSSNHIYQTVTVQRADYHGITLFLVLIRIHSWLKISRFWQIHREV